MKNKDCIFIGSLYLLSHGTFKNLLNKEEQKQCFNFTNFQPLFKTTEIAKSFGDINEIGNREKSNKTW